MAKWTRASIKDGGEHARVTGKPYRLLSEAEWEYAAEAQGTTRYFWGNDFGANNADCNGCGSEWDNKKTAPVRSFKPNAFGLYDMHGNVWEWVDDPWHENYQGTPPLDGSVWDRNDSAEDHVVRGGAWDDPPDMMRSSRRGNVGTHGGGRDVGFRVARTLSQ
jgi:formylglycine-generating enzyme required for sulfatase activity